MLECTLIHAADLHLDAPFRGVSDMLLSRGESRASEKLLKLLRGATFTALERLTDLCLRENADALLLAGDVYNSAQSSLRARLALRDAFLRLESAGVRVFLAHGNHDPLAEGVAAIPWPENVTVFGTDLEAHSLERQGRTLALIHGISHSGPKERANLARRFRHENPASADSDIFHIGLLHCALTDLSGGHAPYAPCSFSDLSESGMDYWALGHIHSCRMFDRQGKLLDMPSGDRGTRETPLFRPFAAYPGSVQGLHVNETGPHGCLVLHLDGRGGLTARQATLAPAQWEILHLELPQELEDIPSLESLLVHKLSTLAPRTTTGENCPNTEKTSEISCPPEAMLVRLCLTGRCSLNHELRGRGFIEDLGEHLNAELEGSGLWLRDIAIETRPLADIAVEAKRKDLAGEVLRRSRSLQDSPEALALTAESCLAPLFQRGKLRKLLPPPKEKELAELAEEATLLCLGLLEGE